MALMTDFKGFIKSEIEETISTKKMLLDSPQFLAQMEKVIEVTLNAYKNGRKTLLAGNGGSAADAQHIAAEFVSRFYYDRPALPSIALTTDTSILTAIGNDYAYENLFSRQIEAQGEKGDVFIAISTSGGSKNVIKAIEAAKKKGVITVALTSAKGQAMADMCDYALMVPSNSTPRIQESHIVIGHMLCGAIEAALFERPTK